MADADANGLVEDLFRRESGHLMAALTRLLGPSNLALAEDVVQEALLRAVVAWRFGPPRDPKAWILQTAKNRAIDLIRQDQRLARLPQLQSEWTLPGTVASALSPAEDAANQLAMMFSICDDALSLETHVTLILRLLCGLSPREIASAFLLDVATIDRRLHRGRSHLQGLGHLQEVHESAEMRARQPSVLHALYLLFSEGYHGSDAENPLHPALCADAIRMAELLLESPATDHPPAHALAALFCFNSARLGTRMDGSKVLIPLATQDRTQWDRSLIERGVKHLDGAANGNRLTRWHLEAGIACEHTLAASVAETNWELVVSLYDELLALAPGPIVAMNRALAVAELGGLRGLEEGRDALLALSGDAKLSGYHFFWASLADLQRRVGRAAEARRLYARAMDLSRSPAERIAYQRKIKLLED